MWKRLKGTLSNRLLPKELRKRKARLCVFGAAIVLLLLSIIIFNVNSEDKHEEESAHEHGEETEGHDDHDGHGDHESEERIVESSEVAQELAKLEVAKAGPEKIDAVIQLNGRIFPNQTKLAQISARYSGVVKEVFKELGDTVKAGERLASVEANGSLSVFPVTSKITGTIIKKKLVSGEFVSDKEILFVVADLRDVWVDLNVTEQDFKRIGESQPVRIRLWDHDETVTTEISYVSPMVHSDSQTMLARAVVDNSSGIWRPGSFVTAEVIVETVESEIAIDRDAIQLIDEKPVVFVKVRDDAFEVRNVTTGLQGRSHVAILNGVKGGEEYVAKNSFVLKAELLKSLAGHDHGH